MTTLPEALHVIGGAGVYTEAQIRVAYDRIDALEAQLKKRSTRIQKLEAAHKDLSETMKCVMDENARLRLDAATAAAINRAAKELPEYYSINVHIEQGYGGVTRTNPDGEVKSFEYDEGDAGLSDCINEAVQDAIDEALKETT